MSFWFCGICRGHKTQTVLMFLFSHMHIYSYFVFFWGAKPKPIWRQLLDVSFLRFPPLGNFPGRLFGEGEATSVCNWLLIFPYFLAALHLMINAVYFWSLGQENRRWEIGSNWWDPDISLSISRQQVQSSPATGMFE